MRARIPQWMKQDFTEVRVATTVAVVRNDFMESFERHRLIDCPSAPMLSVPQAVRPEGRGPVRIVPAGPLGEAVVRRYRRGGLVASVNRATYFLGNRAFEELVTTHRLRRRGAPVPEALAAIQSGTGLGYAACFVTRRIARARPAAPVLAEVNETTRRAVLAAMGRGIRQFHEAGGLHADLNAFNVLVFADEESPAIIIDLDRGSVVSAPVPSRGTRRNLRRLQRSLRKLELGQALEDWEWLSEAYDALPDPPAAA